MCKLEGIVPAGSFSLVRPPSRPRPGPDQAIVSNLSSSSNIFSRHILIKNPVIFFPPFLFTLQIHACELMCIDRLLSLAYYDEVILRL